MSVGWPEAVAEIRAAVQRIVRRELGIAGSDASEVPGEVVRGLRCAGGRCRIDVLGELLDRPPDSVTPSVGTTVQVSAASDSADTRAGVVSTPVPAPARDVAGVGVVMTSGWGPGEPSGEGMRAGVAGAGLGSPVLLDGPDDSGEVRGGC